MKKKRKIHVLNTIESFQTVFYQLIKVYVKHAWPCKQFYILKQFNTHKRNYLQLEKLIISGPYALQDFTTNRSQPLFLGFLMKLLIGRK